MSNESSNTEDMPCQVCGERMYGITDYTTRTKCEECGGNKTKYNAENPAPRK